MNQILNSQSQDRIQRAVDATIDGMRIAQAHKAAIARANQASPTWDVVSQRGQDLGRAPSPQYQHPGTSRLHVPAKRTPPVSFDYLAKLHGKPTERAPKRSWVERATTLLLHLAQWLFMFGASLAVIQYIIR